MLSTGSRRLNAIQGMFIQPGSLSGVELVAWFNAWMWQLTFRMMLVIAADLAQLRASVDRLQATSRLPDGGWVVKYTRKFS